MEMLFFIGKIIGIFVLAQFAIGPILVFIFQKMPKVYRFNILNSDDFLSKRTNTFKVLHETIVSEGFEYIGSSEIKQSNSNLYFSIYNNYESELACTLSTAHSKTLNTTQIEFTQMYSDGSVVNINNNPIFDVYPKNNKKDCFRFPKTNDFKKLHNIARQLISTHKTEAKKITFDRGHEFSKIESHLTNELELLIAKGWVSSNVSKNERKLTIKGALFLTWQLCWPVKLWFDYIDILKSKKALENA